MNQLSNEPTAGAMRAARIAFGSAVDGVLRTERPRICRVEDLASLIDRETHLPELIAACKRADALLSHLMKTVDLGKTFGLNIAELNGVLCELPKIIAKAEGRALAAASIKPEGT